MILKSAAKFITSILIFWIAGFIWFTGSIPSETVDGEIRTEAIIVLTGGSGRVDAGIELLAKGRGRKLLISGVGKNVKLQDLISLSTKELQQAIQQLEEHISLGHDAVSTRGNAEEAKEWIQKHNFKSITLVTSNYHMPRSILKFRALMPKIKIVPYPVFPSNVKLAEWWRFPGTVKLMVREYNKYILSGFK
jgi:uncharacterized SAM-binding protein YcdF (DUF218 family)